MESEQPPASNPHTMSEDRSTINVYSEAHDFLTEIKNRLSAKSYNEAVLFLKTEYENSLYLSSLQKTEPAPIQVLEGTDLPQSVCYCPLCGEQVCRFNFTDELPDIPIPSYLQGAILRCHTDGCRAQGVKDDLRNAHHLVAVSLERDAPASEEIQNVLTEYWSFKFGDIDDPDELSNYELTSCVGIATSNEWKWRPPLSLWNRCSEPETIMESLRSLLRDSYDLDVSVSPASDDCCPTDQYHLHVEGSLDPDIEPGDEGVDRDLEMAITYLRDHVVDEGADLRSTDGAEYTSLVFDGL